MELKKKNQLDTPCLVIDKQKLVHNLVLMQTEVTDHNKQLRPHVKTHKCTELAKLQIHYGAIGLSATKVTEALMLSEKGLKNILITSPIVTRAKLSNLVHCRQHDPGLIVVCDSIDNALLLNSIMCRHSLPLKVLVDVDPGVARTGVSYDSAINLGRHIHNDCEYLSLLGIQCYAGNLQHVLDYRERKQLSSDVMIKAGQLCQEFIKAGLPCEILSGSGTGTYDIDMAVSDVTEVQPGSYTVMDMEYRNIGSCLNANYYDKYQPAMTLLTTVISANHSSHVTVDAGTKALYFDVNTKPKIISHKGLHYDWSVFGDEHGKVTADPGVALPKVGDVIEMIVPHCDPTINLYDSFNVIEDGRVVAQWSIDLRGCCK